MCKNIKISLILLALLVTPFTSIHADNSKGHIAFFMLLPENTQDYAELNEDFNYYYKKLADWLRKNKYTYSRHTATPIKIKNKTFSKQLLGADLGVILINNNNSYKIIKGISTDIDLIMDINNFYQKDT
jgi:hypothetical protein